MKSLLKIIARLGAYALLIAYATICLLPFAVGFLACFLKWAVWVPATCGWVLFDSALTRIFASIKERKA
jgi:hypothetical protein